MEEEIRGRAAGEPREQRNETRERVNTARDEEEKGDARWPIDRCVRVGSYPCAWVHHRSNGYANGPSVTR